MLVAPAAAVLPPCLIVNPKSFRTSTGKLAARAAALATQYGAEVIRAERPAQFIAALDRVLAQGTRKVFVLSGDGTVQAIVEHLATLAPDAPQPQLLILGGGRTNLTAADLGGSGALLRKLESALKRCRDDLAFEVQERELLCIEQAPAPPRRGFFVAGGFIDDVIRAVHHHRASGSGPTRTGHASSTWYVVKLAVLALLGRSPIPYPEMDIRTSDGEHLRGPSRVLIATTLRHRRGLFNPYADRGGGTLRITAVTARAPGFWLSLPRILMGRFTDGLSPERGYLSGRCEHVEVLGMTGYSLDGEDFDTDPALPVHIRTGPRVSFLVP